MNLCIGVKIHSNVMFVYNVHAFINLFFYGYTLGKNTSTLYVLHISNMARIKEITAIIGLHVHMGKRHLVTYGQLKRLKSLDSFQPDYCKY